MSWLDVRRGMEEVGRRRDLELLLVLLLAVHR